MKLISPAKINLTFEVLGKRSDGYHEIRSQMVAIDLVDTLFFSPYPSDTLTCSDPTLSCGEENLIQKARALFRSRFPLSPLAIHLRKQIPQEAGLGGGSSNAATALWGFNEWMGRPATEQELSEMGAEIGSDVPFFFSSGHAWATGRGETIVSADSRPHLSGWIAKPPFGLSTPRVFRELLIPDDCTSLNHLEAPAFRLEPRLFAWRERLVRAGFHTVQMTGSGTAFICLGEGIPFQEGFWAPFCAIERPSDAWYP